MFNFYHGELFDETIEMLMRCQKFRLSTGGQGNGLDPSSGATRAHHPHCEVDTGSTTGAAEHVLNIIHRIYVVLADAVNHQAALDPSLIGRAVRFHRADERAMPRLVTERVG